jgi:hypothetical protein
MRLIVAGAFAGVVLGAFYWTIAEALELRREERKDALAFLDWMEENNPNLIARCRKRYEEIGED